MVLGSFSITSHRAEVIDFTSPYYYSGMSIMSIYREDDSAKLLFFLSPYPSTVYVCVIVSAVIVAILQVCADRSSTCSLYLKIY